MVLVINGYASGTKLQICGYLTTRYAGLKNFGLIFGIMASVISLSSGLGPLLGGISYDAYGNYNAFLVIGMVGSLISGYLIFGLGAYPHWQSSSEYSDTGRAP